MRQQVRVRFRAYLLLAGLGLAGMCVVWGLWARTAWTPRDCDVRSKIITGRVVRFPATPAPGKPLIPIPNAQVEAVSVQTEFDCPGASSAKGFTLTTNAEGIFNGRLAAYAEDIFTFTIRADGCEPLVFRFSRGTFIGCLDYTLTCKEAGKAATAEATIGDK